MLQSSIKTVDPLSVRGSVSTSKTQLFTHTRVSVQSRPQLRAAGPQTSRQVKMAANSRITRTDQIIMKSGPSESISSFSKVNQYSSIVVSGDKINYKPAASNVIGSNQFQAPSMNDSTIMTSGAPKTSVSSITNKQAQLKSFKPANYMNQQIDQVRQKQSNKNGELNSLYSQSVKNFKVNQLQDEQKIQANYQDSLFGSASSSSNSSKAVYPSMLRRTHLNVFKNVSNRMNVVMQAATIDIENMETSTLAPEVDAPAQETPNMPLLPKKKGKLATRLIKRMEKENVRESRDSIDLPTLGPLGDKKFWDFKVFPKAYKNWQQMNKKDKIVAGLIGSIHALALAAPFTYSANMLKLFAVGYLFNCFGITMSFHRQLTHRSFETDKWLERTFAFWGVLGVQGHPIEWVSAHRHHHNQCEKPADPHSPVDGFWWSHMGWMFDSKSQALLFDTSNAKDMKKDTFYQWCKEHYLKITLAQPLVYFAFGGFPAVVWGFALRTVFCWHITWAVNSLSHIWGRQMFKTDDISMNNGLIGILAMGEGWHNNHHAFEDSCRHGMKWWQIDGTWYFILALQKLGLARKLRYPNPARMEKLAWD